MFAVKGYFNAFENVKAFKELLNEYALDLEHNEKK